ncbi:MAG: sulfur carrier protein ThiS [Chloroflexi bacterium]|nr:sulfur carrier protein ThiS [Chloroflexota bacterium]
MQLLVNGKQRDVPEPLTVAGLLQQLDVHPQAVAVELNGEVLRRDAFAERALRKGDRVEIVRMIGGGCGP